MNCRDCSRDFLTDLQPQGYHHATCPSCQADAERRQQRDACRREARYQQIKVLRANGATYGGVAAALGVSYGRAKQLVDTVERLRPWPSRRRAMELRCRAGSFLASTPEEQTREEAAVAGGDDVW